MLFMLTFIASLAFGWYSRKFGFTSMWVTLFNLLFSIYLAVMLTPTIVGYIPAFSEVYYKVVCSLLMSLFIFIIARYSTSMCFDNAFNAPLPDLFSNIAGGVAGFFIMLILTNYLIFSGFAVAVNVIEKPERLANKDFDKASSLVFSSCNFVHRLAGQPQYEMPAEVVDWFKTHSHSALVPSDKKNLKDVVDDELTGK
ncbi:MAG: hypothetical protein JW745_10225 [Sedimentisphaerales bacterium]|nr:hypothetical protein [Sedimentisphaerales bacterium]MBN2843966.1 hypothetical protein [Sedimentisphaerales bacterium]